MATNGTASWATGWGTRRLPRRLPVVVFAAAVAAAIAGAGCDLPRDPNETLVRVRGGTLRVGVAENPPWVRRVGDEAAGVEPALVRAFAEDLGARVAWEWGGVEEHLEALERFELDLVVTGLTQSTPWAKRLGLTKPYYVELVVVGVPPGVPAPRTLEGVSVIVREGSALAADLARRDAIPMRVPDLAGASGPVAAPAWELALHGLPPSGLVLHRTRHVMAVPPGENGWLLHLERFLSGRRDTVEVLLRQAAQASEAAPSEAAP